VKPKPASEPIKPPRVPPDKGKKGRFKDKEEYLAWAEKRKKKLLRRAEVKTALKEIFRYFFVGKRFIISSALIALVAWILFLPFTKSAKIDTRTAGPIPAPGQGETPLAPPISEVSKKVSPGGEKHLYSLDELLPRARKAVVLIKTPQGSGSGFLFPHPGLVATGAPLLGQSDEAEVYLPNGSIKKGVVLKRFPMPLDVAFIQIADFDIDRVPLADSNQCQDGEEAAVVGVPSGDRWRADVVLVKGKILHCFKPYQGAQYLQMSLDLHPATIGGPIFNTWGEVIGISKGELTGTGFEGARYGLAINEVKGLMDQRRSNLDEKTMEQERFFKYVYNDLWKILSTEHRSYQGKIYALQEKGRISAQEAVRLEKKGMQTALEYSSMKDWLTGLTEKVIRGELTKEKAAAQIRAHFEL
jgi:S1-C subfamily serine protease